MRTRDNSGMAIRLEGDEALSRQLNKVAAVTQRRVMRPALLAGLKILRAEARRNAPGSYLQKLIKSRVRTGKRGNVIGQIYVDAGYDRPVMWDGQLKPFAFVANVLEFGSSKRNIRPIAYMRGARDSKGPQALADVARVAGDRLTAEWRKASMSGKTI